MSSLGRVAFGATFDVPIKIRSRPNEQDIDASWDHLTDDVRALWQRVGDAVAAEIRQGVRAQRVRDLLGDPHDGATD